MEPEMTEKLLDDHFMMRTGSITLDSEENKKQLKVVVDSIEVISADPYELGNEFTLLIKVHLEPRRRKR